MKKGFIVTYSFVPVLGRPYKVRIVIIAETETEAYNKAVEMKLRNPKVFESINVCV
jgi:hypothetical protein